MLQSPLKQFEVKTLFEVVSFKMGDRILSIDFTNASLWMMLSVLVILVFGFLALRSRSIIPGRLQCAMEFLYEIVAHNIKCSAGTEGMRYASGVFAVFMFVLVTNLMGMLPMSFSVTSQIIVNLALAGAACTYITFIGIARHGFGFLRLFVPRVPWPLLIILTPIEIITYLIRPISLSVRLFANMMAGHIMLKIFASFVAMSGMLFLFPLAFTIFLTALEVIIALLQAYIFTVLVCVYLGSVIYIEH